MQVSYKPFYHVGPHRLFMKSLMRPNLDHRDVICDQPFKASFSNKIESVLYNAAIAVAGANKAFLVINCVMTWVLGISTTEYGWGDCTYSTKFFQPSNHHIYLTYFPEWDILPDTLTLSMYFLIQLKHFKYISFLKYQTFRALVMFHNALLKSIGSVKRSSILTTHLE